MYFKLRESDHDKIVQIEKRRKQNFYIMEKYSNYLIKDPTFITKDMIEGITNTTKIDDETAFKFLFSAVCSLDINNNSSHKQLANEYIFPYVKKLDTSSFAQDPYYKNIKIPNVKVGKWKLQYDTFDPYQGFIYDDLVVLNDLTEIPRLGFFSDKFNYPSVLENDNQWMMITPEETKTIENAIDMASGKVITFGLGLGYYPYMVSQKNNVHSVTIIEKSSDVIDIFKEYILPQFPNKDKIHIVHSDAFEYIQSKMAYEKFDHFFGDIWRDATDGLDLYLQMKSLEYLCPTTKYSYWIETSLLSRLRWIVFDIIYDQMNTKNVKSKYYRSDDVVIDIYQDATDYLRDPFLKELATTLK